MVLGKIFGGDTLKTVGTVIDDLHFSGEEKEKLKLQMKEIDAKLKEKQLDINKAEASHRSVFVSGWRPFLGWVSGLSIGYVYLFQPILDMILQMFGVEVDWVVLDLGQLMPLVLGMLGLGGLRSFEKAKGLTK
jgi:hypothetical protein|tara:strand:- start:628 stop:1026 length:399 start_codon:yes stop_codon:yes gene_type:complete